MAKPRFRVALKSGELVPVNPDPLKRARERFGRPFGHERGSDFKWISGPTVLTAWKAKRDAEKQA